MRSCIFALDIGGTFLKACLFDQSGTLIGGSFDREPVDSNGPLSEVKPAYQKLFARMRDMARSRGYEISAVAADTPGPFDFAAGMSKMEHKYTALYGIALRPWFTEVLGDVPVAFLHDSSAFLCGVSSLHPEIRNCAGVMIGTGLGFAVMQNGVIQQNKNGGPAYSIFRLPCRGLTAEDYVSARAVVRRYNEQAPLPAADAKEVADRALAGDAVAQDVYASMGTVLAEVIAPTLKKLGTQALYLGGQVSKSFPLFEATLREGLREVATLTRIEPAEDLDMAHLCGVTSWYLQSEKKSEMNPYPMKLEAVCKDIIWGGTQLGEQFHKPSGKIAEAWELTVHPEGINRIENGACKGKLLSDYLGTDQNFPIMIKLIDACDRLSIQVHPVKTEMWYIVDCKPDAKLVYGLKKKFDEAEFRAALENGTVEELLNFVPVHPGDVFFIPQGLVHAIGAGILIAEIQENSNVTYRVYDYGRLQNGKPRELHVEQAMKTIKDFTDEQIEAARYECGRGSTETIANCPLFRVDRRVVQGKTVLHAADPFTSVICLNGEGTIGGETIVKGDSFYLPNGCGDVTVEGKLELILTTK